MKSRVWSGFGRLWLNWTAITTLAGGIVYGLSIILSALIGFPIVIAAVFAAAVGGLAAGLFQQRLLNPYIRVRPVWQWATMVGWIVGIPLAALSTLLIRSLSDSLGDGFRLTLCLLGAAAPGVIASIGQWRALRLRMLHANWWLLANGVGWAMVWLAVLGVTWFVRPDGLPTSLDDLVLASLLGTLAGWTLGLEQGIALIGMFTQAIWDAEEDRVE